MTEERDAIRFLLMGSGFMLGAGFAIAVAHFAPQVEKEATINTESTIVCVDDQGQTREVIRGAREVSSHSYNEYRGTMLDGEPFRHVIKAGELCFIEHFIQDNR